MANTVKECCSDMSRLLHSGVLGYGILEHQSELCLVSHGGSINDRYHEHEIPVRFCPFCGTPIDYEDTVVNEERYKLWTAHARKMLTWLLDEVQWRDD